MKRTVRVLCAVLLAALFAASAAGTAFAAGSFAEEWGDAFAIEGIYAYGVEDGCAWIAGVDKINLPSEVVVPETLGGYPVTALGEFGCFSGCDTLISVVLPDTLTDIGAYAFSFCVNLKKVQFGSKLESIGHFSFEDCEKLTEITLPATVKHISNDAFNLGGDHPDEETGAFVGAPGGLQSVRFLGTEEQWKKIDIYEVYPASRLLNAKMTFGAAPAPSAPSAGVKAGRNGLGDPDGDGYVSAADARLALRYAVNLERLTAEQKKAADLDFDNDVTAVDARSMLRIAVRLDKVPKAKK